MQGTNMLVSRNPTFHLHEELKAHLEVNKEAFSSAEMSTEKMNLKMDTLLTTVAKLKSQQEQSLKEDYAREYVQASNDYTEFVEKENEADLRAALETEKNQVTRDRARLLHSTIRLALDAKEKKTVLAALETEKNELDEELRFLTKQMDFADEQNLLLEQKVQSMRDELTRISPNTPALEELRLLELLPVSLKKKEPEYPQLLELRTTKHFHKYSTKNMHDNPIKLEEGLETVPEPPQPTQEEAEQLKNFEKLSTFLSDNKYVVEAIFENVLLEANMYKFPLSDVGDTERKQLMERLLSSDEFKEYIYQKIMKVHDDMQGPTQVETEKANAHMMSAVTQIEEEGDQGSKPK